MSGYRRITGNEVGDALRSATRSIADISASDFLSFDFLDLEVDVGDVFLIRLLPDLPPESETEVFWGTDFGNPGAGSPEGTYADGSAFRGDNPITELVQDRGFRTFVDDEIAAVPEPGTLALFGTALFGIGLRRRKARA